jgi:hypothetical protein
MIKKITLRKMSDASISRQDAAPTILTSACGSGFDSAELVAGQPRLVGIIWYF